MRASREMASAGAGADGRLPGSHPRVQSQPERLGSSGWNNISNGSVA
jgi:hypothetical protein